MKISRKTKKHKNAAPVMISDHKTVRRVLRREQIVPARDDKQNSQYSNNKLYVSTLDLNLNYKQTIVGTTVWTID